MTSTKQLPEIYGSISAMSALVEQQELRNELGGVFPIDVVDPVLLQAGSTARRLGDVTMMGLVELATDRFRDCTQRNVPVQYSNIIVKGLIEIAQKDMAPTITRIKD